VNKKGEYILWIGAGLLGTVAILAFLILIGVVKPNIFPPTGDILDVNPLSSGLLTFLLLVVLLYVGTRVLDFGLKYRKLEDESSKEEQRKGTP